MLVSISPRPGQDDEERVYVFVSLGIEYGITAAMRQLYRGGTTVLTQTSRPETFFASVQRDQPTRVVTTTGNASSLVAYAAKSLPESPKICAGIKSIMVAGSFVSPALREGIVNRICSRLEVDYGSTESGSLAMSTPETYALRPKSVGRLNAWVHAEAVDENDQPLPPGQSGVLRFKSPLLTKEYLDDEQATARAFRNGWFYPGDTGFVGAAGYLFLRGRVDHIVNLGGNKIDVRLIEQFLDDQPEIIESAVVPVNRGTGAQVLVAVVEERAPFDAEALRRLCRERLGNVYVPDAIVKIDALPRNESGKVKRLALAASIKFSADQAVSTEGEE
jgi:acyl-coenzyme A synthetase/AMP-(fatty) acid ligase